MQWRGSTLLWRSVAQSALARPILARGRPIVGRVPALPPYKASSDDGGAMEEGATVVVGEGGQWASGPTRGARPSPPPLLFPLDDAPTTTTFDEGLPATDGTSRSATARGTGRTEAEAEDVGYFVPATAPSLLYPAQYTEADPGTHTSPPQHFSYPRGGGGEVHPVQPGRGVTPLPHAAPPALPVASPLWRSGGSGGGGGSGGTATAEPPVIPALVLSLLVGSYTWAWLQTEGGKDEHAAEALRGSVGLSLYSEMSGHPASLLSRLFLHTDITFLTLNAILFTAMAPLASTLVAVGPGGVPRTRGAGSRSILTVWLLCGVVGGGAHLVEQSLRLAGHLKTDCPEEWTGMMRTITRLREAQQQAEEAEREARSLGVTLPPHPGTSSPWWGAARSRGSGSVSGSGTPLPPAAEATDDPAETSRQQWAVERVYRARVNMADAAGRAQEAWLSAMAASGPVATRVVNTTLSGCLDANAGLWMYTGLELAARGRAALLVQVCTVLLFEYLAAARHLPLPAFGRVALAEGEREALRGHAAQGEALGRPTAVVYHSHVADLTAASVAALWWVATRGRHIGRLPRV